MSRGNGTGYIPDKSNLTGYSKNSPSSIGGR